MRIGIMGAGAVGVFFGGGLLHRAGHDVIFLARGQHLKAMKESSLNIQADHHSMKNEGVFSNVKLISSYCV